MTIFTLINSSACFFYENLLTLLVSKPLLWKDGSFTWKDWWLLLLFSFLHVSHFWSLSDGGGEEIIRWLATEVWQYFHNNIYVSGPILVKLANELNPSCLSPTFVKKFFQQNTWKQAGGGYSWLDFFCLLHCIYINFQIILSIFLADKR